MTADPAIVLVTTSYPIEGNGSEAAGSFVADLATELSTHCPVRVVAPGNAAAWERITPKLEIFRYPAPERALSTLRPWHPGDMWTILSVLKAGQAATRKAALAGPSKHLLALWALPCGHWARAVSRETGVPYSTWTLGSDIWSLGRIPVIRGRLRQVLRDATICFADGMKLAEDTRRIAKREVEFLPSTRTLQRTRTAPLRSRPPYRLLFLGRWHPNKGVDLLLDALKLLSDSDWQKIKTLTICGGGPLHDQVHAQAQALQKAGRPITLRGYLNKEQAEDAILEADYLLIPSRIESIPVIFSDAMKLGTPVIATPVGDLQRILEERNVGILSVDTSTTGITNALQRAIREHPARFENGVVATSHLFDMQRIANRIVRSITSP